MQVLATANTAGSPAWASPAAGRRTPGRVPGPDGPLWAHGAVHAHAGTSVGSHIPTCGPAANLCGVSASTPAVHHPGGCDGGGAGPARSQTAQRADRGSPGWTSGCRGRPCRRHRRPGRPRADPRRPPGRRSNLRAARRAERRQRVPVALPSRRPEWERACCLTSVRELQRCPENRRCRPIVAGVGSAVQGCARRDIRVPGWPFEPTSGITIAR